MTQNPLVEIELLVRARYALLLVPSEEFERVDEMLELAAERLSLHYAQWRRASGLRRGRLRGDPIVADTREPVKALAQVPEIGAGLFHFRELGPHLADPEVESHLVETIEYFSSRRGAVVLSGHALNLPDALRRFSATVRLPPPSFDEYRGLLERTIRTYSARQPIRVEITQEERVRLVNNLAGLTLHEAERIVSRRLIEDGALTSHDVALVGAAKQQQVEQDGLLEYTPADAGLGEVAGLAGLKRWLAQRRAIVADPQRALAAGLGFPRGMLLLGVPGCGKSLCAKAVAHEWGLPLLKLDPANLYDKFVGESEKNFKRALATAERLAPIVLFIDELEKAFAAGGTEGDGGLSQRIFGSFLAWLQDRRTDVFVVATANDVSRLPPEFIRKGRFDEIFFVDLQGAEARREVFRIHLARRRQDPAGFGLDALAARAEGFSGAEIEAAVVGALAAAFAADRPLGDADLEAELRRTRPLSATMAEHLSALRAWAAGRTAMAD